MSKEPKNNLPVNDDAFEREAAEGFGMLGSEEEIAALKAETDNAFAEQFKQQQLKAKAPWLWMAAAFVIIGLGLTLFSVLQPEKEKNMAQNQSSKMLEFPSDAKVPEEISDSNEAESKNYNRKELDLKAPAPKSKIGYASEAASNAEPLAAMPSAEANADIENQIQTASTNDAFSSSGVSAKNLAPVVVATTPAASEPAKKKIVERKENTNDSEDAVRSTALESNIAVSSDAREKNEKNVLTIIMYQKGTKQLESDTKKLLKAITLPKLIVIELFLTADGTVERAAISSKDSIAEADLTAAQNELKKLPKFAVSPANGANPPYRYSFTLKR